ncbi:type-1 angiotensin II receptor-associated protein-like isoform X2 [Mizuhopecten yessoensis]|uniref:Type-1 angiotensin II receptor-associated protein-like n=1 Tax=Mizuhopecten yessoensis TaxID=6573 RepID=A0A210PXN5_MIZYE|nr:type-1 angiotensin II receptor-associated protein-like isoform X2 [Mizuhopecten yessoensis]OWF41219.1 Type-1 angiotensin II receptor-associated protein-like [Mizuhopecten yessoensis]
MNPPSVSLKAIIIVHFVLVIWASMMEGYLPPAYWAMNLFILMLGVWGIACPESADAILMFLILHLISILQDIIFIAIHQPLAYDAFERPNSKRVSEFRFSTGMSIVNLIVKPFTSFLLYRIFKDRGGEYGTINIPGFPNFGQSPTTGGQYENIDQPVPTNQVDSPDDHNPYSDKSPVHP